MLSLALAIAPFFLFPENTHSNIELSSVTKASLAWSGLELCIEVYFYPGTRSLLMDERSYSVRNKKKGSLRKRFQQIFHSEIPLISAAIVLIPKKNKLQQSTSEFVLRAELLASRNNQRRLWFGWLDSRLGGIKPCAA